MKANLTEHYLARLIREKELPPSRAAVFMAILQLWKEQGRQNPFHITRKKVMNHSGIKSIVTYHRCISELKNRGMVDYRPSYHPGLGSEVMLK
jgi:hypothetical protein